MPRSVSTRNMICMLTALALATMPACSSGSSGSASDASGRSVVSPSSTPTTTLPPEPATTGLLDLAQLPEGWESIAVVGKTAKSPAL